MRRTDDRMKNKNFAEKVIKWYRKNGRDFPWRETTDPYKILITEILLQRTKAHHVNQIWNDFFSKYPDLKSLKESPEAEIKEQIKSLGILRRANTLKKLTKKIYEEYNNKIPDNEEIFKLPGVGDYIGNAVLCFAYDQKRVIIDSNIIRVLSKIFDIEFTGEGYKDEKIRKKAEEVMPESNLKEYYFGLIDFGEALRRKRKEKDKQILINKMMKG